MINNRNNPSQNLSNDRNTFVNNPNADDYLPTRRSQTDQTQRNDANQANQTNRRNRPLSISEEERLFSEDIANLVEAENYSPFMNTRLNAQTNNQRNINLLLNPQNRPNQNQINQNFPGINTNNKTIKKATRISSVANDVAGLDLRNALKNTFENDREGSRRPQNSNQNYANQNQANYNANNVIQPEVNNQLENFRDRVAVLNDNPDHIQEQMNSIYNVLNSRQQSLPNRSTNNYGPERQNNGFPNMITSNGRQINGFGSFSNINFATSTDAMNRINLLRLDQNNIINNRANTMDNQATNIIHEVYRILASTHGINQNNAESNNQINSQLELEVSSPAGLAIIQNLRRENEFLRYFLSFIEFRNQTLTLNQLLRDLQIVLSNRNAHPRFTSDNTPPNLFNNIENQTRIQNEKNDDIMSDMFHYSELCNRNSIQSLNYITELSENDNTAKFFIQNVLFNKKKEGQIFTDYYKNASIKVNQVKDFLVFSDKIQDAINSEDLFSKFKSFFVKIEPIRQKMINHFDVCQICTFFGVVFGEKMKCVNRDCGHLMHEVCNVVLCKNIKMANCDYKTVCPICTIQKDEY